MKLNYSSMLKITLLTYQKLIKTTSLEMRTVPLRNSKFGQQCEEEIRE
jgi:hypothetical protein